ncbi:MAG: hypothetical protein A3E87_01695 [Gammaproteobacteria bacterium RIFCSPHIGHO2_12_FULL_35_23]|nr:MAG: hypothetical protein A3E87_01695 [Gammaproteobacteria bacterium RIFCSPHIGHO2_12_FULL_35_23]
MTEAIIAEIDISLAKDILNLLRKNLFSDIEAQIDKNFSHQTDDERCLIKMFFTHRLLLGLVDELDAAKQCANGEYEGGLH